MEINKTVISVSLDTELLKKINVLVEEDGRSRSSLINHLLYQSIIDKKLETIPGGERE